MSKVQVVWFRDLKLWDLKSNLFDNEMFANSKFPLVQVSTFLHRNKTPIKIQNNETYKRVTIKTKGQGCHLRDTLKGSLIGTKNQFLIKEGQFLISKIDARNGAFGVVSQDIHNAIITGNFWTYDIDESKVNAYFLALFTSTQYFINFCKACSGGTTGRHYLDENKFLNAKIPLPPLKIQKQIVAKIESIKTQIKALQEEEKRLKDEIEAYIYIALGLEKKQEAKRQKVFIVRFKDLDRWDTRHNQSIAINLCHTDSIPYHTKQPNCHTDSASCHTDTTSPCHTEAIAEVSTNIESKTRFFAVAQNDNKSKKDISAQYDKPINTANLKALLDSIPTPPPHGWEVKTLGEICEIINRNWHKYYKNETFPYIQISNVTQKGIDGYSLIHYDNAPSRAKTLVKTGELLISLTRPNLGAFAVVEQEYNNFVVSSGFAVVDSKNIVTNHYIKHILQSQIGIDIFNQIMSGALYPAISQGDLQNLKIPLPPLSVQEKIVAHIQKIGSSIAATQEKAKALELELTHYIESTL